MKKSLFKRILSVSLVALSINPGINCYAYGDDKACDIQTVEGRIPKVPIQIKDRILSLLYRLSELQKHFVPFRYKTMVLLYGDNWSQTTKTFSLENTELMEADVLEYTQEYGRDKFERATNDFNTVFSTEWINAFKKYLDLNFFEEFDYILGEVEQVCQSFNENQCVRISLDLFIKAVNMALNIAERQDVNAEPSEIEIRNIEIINHLICEGANILRCIIY